MLFEYVICCFRLIRNITEETDSELYSEEIYERLSQACKEVGITAVEKNIVPFIIAGMFPTTRKCVKYMPETQTRKGCLRNVAFASPFECDSLDECLKLTDGVKKVSGSEGSWPILVEVTTNEYLDNKPVVNRVELFEDHFELFVHNKRVDLAAIQIENCLPFNQHHAVFRIAQHLRFCGGISNSENIPANLARLSYRNAGSGYHARSCAGVVSIQSRQNACVPCRRMVWKANQDGRLGRTSPNDSHCSTVLSCIQQQAIYVRGTADDLPIQFCVIDVSSKIDGRYVTKEVSLFESEFSVSVDGNYVDIESCGFSSHLGFKQHHQILDFIRVLKLCKGMPTAQDDDWCLRLHEESGEEAVRTWHSLDCDIVRPLNALVCLKCGVTEPEEDEADVEMDVTGGLYFIRVS